jgi:hypothetical protein
LQNKGINQIKTPLFNSNDLADSTKINAIIRDTFIGKQSSVPDNLQELFLLPAFPHMFDFSHVLFDKAIKTTPEKKIKIESKYPSVKLCGDDGVCNILIAETPSRKISDYFTGDNLWVSIAQMNGGVITDTKKNN